MYIKASRSTSTLSESAAISVFVCGQEQLKEQTNVNKLFVVDQLTKTNNKYERILDKNSLANMF